MQTAGIIADSKRMMTEIIMWYYCQSKDLVESDTVKHVKTCRIVSTENANFTSYPNLIIF